MDKLYIMTKIDKFFQILLLLIVVSILVWQVRDYQGTNCQEQCYTYCDTIGQELSDINIQLQDLELIE